MKGLWEEFRQLMPVATKWAYLDHAAVAPIPATTADAVRRWAEQAALQGELACTEWKLRLRHTRERAATLLGCDVDEIALVGNTTTGINLVAFGLEWRPGDNVVFPASEFPTNQYPWLALARLGIEPRRVEVQPGRPLLDSLRAACDRNTKLIAVSWVQFADGYRIDLADLCQMARQVGALTCVDAIQGLGVFPINVKEIPVDFLAADGHKWLLGPEGAGIFYVRKEHLDRMKPIGIGWQSVVHAHDFHRIELNLKPSAERFEGGSHNSVGMIGLGESLSLLTRLEPARIALRVLELTDYACEGLTGLGARIISNRSPGLKSGIVAFELPGVDPHEIKQRCYEAGIVLSVRGGRLRISPHAYNNEEDVDRLLGVLREFRSGKL